MNLQEGGATAAGAQLEKHFVFVPSATEKWKMGRGVRVEG